jgi:type I restriction enzyme M protein
VEENGQDASNLSLHAQDSNGTAWVICKMNMFLHGITERVFIDNEDCLKTPPMYGGERLFFHRVITNPPFSMGYEQEGMQCKERFTKYGWAPETGKHADLMFAQHVLASLTDDGVCATVMPHGVLFRGGKEGKIRRAIVQDDVIEAIISVPSNLFYGTGIPACILVMRRPGKKERARQRSILFINADREFEAGRAENFLRAEHVEKIVSAFQSWETRDGFSRAVPLSEIQGNNYNLSVRVYVDNSPPAEPQDVRGHLTGGVPRSEVADHRALFDAHGLDTRRVFTVRDDNYYLFAEKITNRGQIEDVVKASPTVERQEQALRDAFGKWWADTAGPRLEKLPNKNNVMRIRADFIRSFDAGLEPVGMLDHYKRVGVLVTWWDQVKEEFKTVAVRGFEELVDGWVDFITDMIEDEESRKRDRFDPFDHKLVKKLLPEYLKEIEDTKIAIARLEGEIGVFEAGPDDEGGDGETEGEEARNYARELVDEIKELKGRLAEMGVRGARGRKKSEDAEQPPEATGILQEIADLEKKLAPWKALREELALARRKLKELGAALAVRLTEARAALSAKDCRDLVVELARDELETVLRKYMGEHLREVLDVLSNFWDKYAVSLAAIEKLREAATGDTARFLKALGYA